MQTATASRTRAKLGFKPVELSIIAGATARLTMPELAAIRKESFDTFPKRLSPQLLRHSDDQTLAALVAVSEATKSANLRNHGFQDWVIVSSSRNLGRSAFAAVIDKYRSEGPWGVSVQVIPHCTAHAVAGTISLALESHGPCIGAGGDTDGEVEALFSTACILRNSDWHGAWIVFSCWLPELEIDSSGRPTADSTCFAAAVAVTRQWSPDSLGQICFDAPGAYNDLPGDLARRASSTSFAEFLSGAGGNCRTWTRHEARTLRVRVELTGDGWREPVQLSRAAAKNLFDQSGLGSRSHADLTSLVGNRIIG
jgi:hypothetical protein